MIPKSIEVKQGTQNESFPSLWGSFFQKVSFEFITAQITLFRILKPLVSVCSLLDQVVVSRVLKFPRIY